MKPDIINSKSKSERNHWWKPIEESFTGLNLKGLKITCPKCKETGFVITRWIKGPSLKPVYILHIKWNKVRKVCELNQEQSNNIKRNISIYESDIKTLLSKKKPFVLFSGGKDSIATLFHLKNIAKQIDVDLTAIFIDTTAGIPENTKYVKKVCRYLKVDLKIVKPKTDYFTLAKEWGIPSFRYRWCCRELKIKPVMEFLESIEEPKVVFDGIRAAESYIRRQYIPIWYHPSFKCLSVSPIFYWLDNEVDSFINSNGLPKTLLHSLGTSTECWCGAYKTEKDFRNLYKLNKDIYYKLVEIEDKSKNRYTFIYKNGKKKSLRNLKKQILKDKNSSF